jgi:proteasome lid subunit RPN8/RPN11
VAGRTEFDALPVGNPPDLSNAIWHGGGDGSAPAYLSVCVRPAAIDQLQDHAVSNTSVELGGVLLGYAYRHEQRVFVEVQAAIPVQTADHGPVHFTFTADSWSQVHKDRAVRYPALNIIGWFHTHPGLGVFFSGDDVVVHKAAFTMPWHVGLVVDPLSKQAALFGWDAGQVRSLPGLYELTTGNGPTVLPWRVIEAEVWSESYEARLADDAAYVRRTQTGLTQLLAEPWVPLAVGGVALFLAVLLLGTMLISANRRAAVLETISQGYLGAHMSAAEAAGLADCPTPTLMLMDPLAAESISEAEVDILGQAQLAGAHHYLVQTRPAGATDWVELSRFRRPVRVGQLATWETANYPSGQYELRLSAVDRDEQLLTPQSSCTIVLELN